MRIALSSASVALGLMAGMWACAEQRQALQRGDTEALAALVAEEASTELALAPGAQVVLPNQVHLEEGPRVGDSVATFRAWIPRDHWHAYQVALIGNKTVVLGGFQNPDVASVAVAFAQPGGSTASLREVAEKLAVLADNSGGVQYAFPGRPEAHALRAAWHDAAPDLWPNDTTLNLGDGRHRVRLTLLSQETRSYTQHWVPTVYAFTFDANGRLLAWSRRSGNPVPAGKIPVDSAVPSVAKP